MRMQLLHVESGLSISHFAASKKNSTLQSTSGLEPPSCVEAMSTAPQSVSTSFRSVVLAGSVIGPAGWCDKLTQTIQC